MKSELILMCHAATHAMKTGHFPTGDDAIEPSAPARIARLAEAMTPDRIMTGTARAARETAHALALSSVTTVADTAWNDMDYGEWSGRPIRDIHDTDPDGLNAWLSDPASSPPGGESLETLHKRVSHALLRQTHGGMTLVITHAIVVKVALAAALGTPLESVYSMDLEPLSTIMLTRASDAWRVRLRPSIPA